MLSIQNFPKWLISDETFIFTFDNQSIKIQNLNPSSFLFAILTIASVVPLFLICNLRIVFYKIYFRKKNISFKFSNLLIGNYYDTDEFYAKRELNRNNIDFDLMNQFEINNYLNKNLRIFSYQRIILESCFDFINIYKIKDNKMKNCAFFTSIRNMPFYVIYRVFFGYQKKLKLQRVHLLALPLILMAAIEKERLPCSVYLHGLSFKIPQSLFPSIDCLHVISEDEKQYFSNFMSKNKIKLYKLNSLSEYANNAVLLLRQNLHFTGAHPDLMSVDEIHALSSFLSDLNIDLYYKTHPKTNLNCIEELKETLGIDDSKLIKNLRPISDNVELIQPKFIFGWLSSGLAESLRLNIIPVMVNAAVFKTENLQNFSNFSYENRCLNFKTDKDLLLSCSTNNDVYMKILNQLQHS